MRRLRRLVREEAARAASLFAGAKDTLVWSCLMGCMGEVWVDDALRPKVALASLGDFSFFAGAADGAQAEEAASLLPALHPSGFVLAVPMGEGWERLLRRRYAQGCQMVTRYALCKEGGRFDRARLEGLANALDGRYALKPLDREAYARVLCQEWSRDFCSQYGGWEDYAAHSLGVVALDGEEIVGGASGYSWFKGGIEIEIDVRQDHRRRGVATACAARLILNCLDQGLYPSWDAANPESLHLAQKLGYRFSHEYPTCRIHWESGALR